jgi:hypothetical protein
MRLAFHPQVYLLPNTFSWTMWSGCADQQQQTFFTAYHSSFFLLASVDCTAEKVGRCLIRWILFRQKTRRSESSPTYCTLLTARVTVDRHTDLVMGTSCTRFFQATPIQGFAQCITGQILLELDCIWSAFSRLYTIVCLARARLVNCKISLLVSTLVSPLPFGQRIQGFAMDNGLLRWLSGRRYGGPHS